MEGRRKEVILLVLALAALGLALYTFRAKPTPAPPAGPAVAAQPAPAPEPTRPQIPGLAGGDQQQAGTAEPAAGDDAGDVQRNPFSAPDGSPGPMAPPSHSGPAGPEEPDIPEWTDGSLTLTGIVEGKPDVAILRQGDQRLFVKVGDPIGGGYRVHSIGNHQVTLAGPQGTVILRMGGRQ
jgi:hypothetical protein